MEPKKFGRYEIRGEIGRGGMATVYHAWDPRFEREVALKVLPHEMLHDLQFRTRFEREAKTIAMLEHPAIVPVYDFGEEDGQPFFVMRYMPGGSLSDRMKAGPLPVHEAARLLAHIAPALDEAHAKGIIHRDLKPGNILYDQYNDPYISDFGIAKLAESQSNVTGSAIVGTPAYMSPEQAQGEGIDGRSDIYGLGVILFEMLTGQQPYHGDTPMSVVVKHITDPVPHILDIKPDLPCGVEQVVEKAMAKDRTERYQSVRDLAEDLGLVDKCEPPKYAGTPLAVSGSLNPTVVEARPPVQTLAQTLAMKKPAPQAAPVAPAGPRRHMRLWMGLITGAVLFLVVAVVGLLVLNGKFHFLLAAAPTPTQSVASQSPGLQASPTVSTPVVAPPVASTDTAAPTNTPEPSPTAAPTIPSVPSLGGADQIAFLSDNNIWTMNTDGTDLQQRTTDNTEKHNLIYSVDGQSIFFLSGKCIHYLSSVDYKDVTVTCFTSSTYLESFEPSPDGKQVAITLDRVLYIEPLDVKVLANARNWTQLRDMGGCLVYGDGHLYGQPIIKTVRWSADGKLIAADTMAMSKTFTREDLVLVFDVSRCDGNISTWLDNFPGSRFTMINYQKSPIIPFFSWDGQSLFLMNTAFRFKSGYLYGYNMEKKAGSQLRPLADCCYQSPVWSPDGSTIMFAYQDMNGGGMELYALPYGSLGTGATYEPFDLPDTLFKRPGTSIEIAFRKAK